MSTVQSILQSQWLLRSAVVFLQGSKYLIVIIMAVFPLLIWGELWKMMVDLIFKIDTSHPFSVLNRAENFIVLLTSGVALTYSSYVGWRSAAMSGFVVWLKLFLPMAIYLVVAALIIKINTGA